MMQYNEHKWYDTVVAQIFARKSGASRIGIYSIECLLARTRSANQKQPFSLLALLHRNDHLHIYMKNNCCRHCINWLDDVLDASTSHMQLLVLLLYTEYRISVVCWFNDCIWNP